jgi:Flp pilus assembly protein CpaB
MRAPSLGAVLATRQGSLLLALVCAALAALVLIVALRQFQTHVRRPLPQATVLVATGRIEPGMTGAQLAARHLYRSTPVVSTQLSAGAIGDAAQIATATASARIMPGQQLTTADFETIIGVDQAVPAGQRAVEISTSEAPGATDITQAGSRVDVWSRPTDGAAFLIVADVRVLKPATPTPVTLGNRSVGGDTLVLALPADTVRRVLSNAGSLYLALRPAVHHHTGGSAPTNRSGGHS